VTFEFVSDRNPFLHITRRCSPGWRSCQITLLALESRISMAPINSIRVRPPAPWHARPHGWSGGAQYRSHECTRAGCLWHTEKTCHSLCHYVTRRSNSQQWFGAIYSSSVPFVLWLKNQGKEIKSLMSLISWKSCERDLYLARMPNRAVDRAAQTPRERRAAHFKGPPLQVAVWTPFFKEIWTASPLRLAPLHHFTNPCPSMWEQLQQTSYLGLTS
jgi:hypothetical protein